jgi:hypothetical protein
MSFQLPPGFKPSQPPSSSSQGGSSGQSQEDQAAAAQKQAAQDEMKRNMIAAMLEPAARERREFGFVPDSNESIYTQAYCHVESSAALSGNNLRLQDIVQANHACSPIPTSNSICSPSWPARVCSYVDLVIDHLYSLENIPDPPTTSSTSRIPPSPYGSTRSNKRSSHG